MSEDGGVLGNLPNSRPGKRSAKRSGAGEKRSPSPPPPEPPARETPSGAEAVADVVRTAAGVAATGVRVAGVVGRELLRRVPRP